MRSAFARARPSWARLVAVIAAGVVTQGCVAYRTRLIVRDVAQLSVLQRGLVATREVLPAGTATAAADLPRDLPILAPEARVVRDHAGLRIECDRCPDRTMTLADGGGRTAWADGRVDASTGGASVELGFPYVVSRFSMEEKWLPKGRREVLVSEVSMVLLSTEWTNVEQVVERRYLELRGLWWLLPGLLLTATGASLIGIGETGPGLATLVPGLALDGLGLAPLFWPPEEMVLDRTRPGPR
ncbi:MAG: hypothetical protein L6Q95_02900 [Planctomycetes bacterium]|nr:hypothetical protein [Planctomycetota bacterium]